MPSEKLIVGADEVAEWIAASDRTVRDLADKGIAVRVGRGRYDLKASVAGTVKHLREMAAGRGVDERSHDLTAEKARLAKEQADAVALKNAKTRGELIPADEVLFGWSHILTNTRLNIQAAVPRIAQELGLTKEQTQAVDAIMQRALTDLADEPLRSLGGDDHEGDERASAAT